MEHHVFISYRRVDSPVAETIEAGLREAGLRCWRDRVLEWGVDFPLEIREAIKQSQVVLVMISEHAGESQWMVREVDMAFEQERPVLPVVTGVARVEGELAQRVGHLQHLQVAGSPTPQDIAKILHELRNRGVGSLDEPTDRELNTMQLSRDFRLAGDQEGLLRSLSEMTRRHFRGTPGEGWWGVHGLRHTNGIIANLVPILSDRQREDSHAAFCLVAAACLHDLGLIQRRTVGAEAETREGSVRPTDIRTHHRLSEQAALRLGGEVGLSQHEAGAAARVSYYHNASTNPQEVARDPDLAELAGAFRLANACDLGPFRAPSWFWEDNRTRLWQQQLEPSWEVGAAAFWLKNLLISRIDMDRQRREIVIRGGAPLPELMFVPQQVSRDVARSAAQLAPFVGVWHVAFEAADESVCAAGLAIEDIVWLGAHMYADPQAILRSSSDIADYFVNAVVAVTSHVSDSDAHCDKAFRTLQSLSEHLTRQRPELHALHALRFQFEAVAGPCRTPAQALAALGGHFAELKQRRTHRGAKPETRGTLQEIALRTFESATRLPDLRATESFTLFAFGHSGPVAHFIQYCTSVGHTVKVYTPVMRPVGEGPTLKVVEGLAALADQGVEVEVVPDAAIPHILKRGAPHRRATARPAEARKGPEGCDLVLMGCEALVTDATGHLTRVANSLGCRAVAQLAAGCGVPVWVLTEETKHLTPVPHDSPFSETPDRPGIGTVPASCFLYEPAASERAAESEAVYPRSEEIPVHLVDRVITDRGEYLPPPEAERAGGSARAT